MTHREAKIIEFKERENLRFSMHKDKAIETLSEWLHEAVDRMANKYARRQLEKERIFYKGK